MTIDQIRQCMPRSLPFTIREVILGNVVVGNFDTSTALMIANAIDKRHPEQPNLFK